MVADSARGYLHNSEKHHRMVLCRYEYESLKILEFSKISPKEVHFSEYHWNIFVPYRDFSEIFGFCARSPQYILLQKLRTHHCLFVFSETLWTMRWVGTKLFRLPLNKKTISEHFQLNFRYIILMTLLL